LPIFKNLVPQHTSKTLLLVNWIPVHKKQISRLWLWKQRLPNLLANEMICQHWVQCNI
jgi:hypothetical protein